MRASDPSSTGPLFQPRDFCGSSDQPGSRRGTTSEAGRPPISNAATNDAEVSPQEQNHKESPPTPVKAEAMHGRQEEGDFPSQAAVAENGAPAPEPMRRQEEESQSGDAEQGI